MVGVGGRAATRGARLVTCSTCRNNGTTVTHVKMDGEQTMISDEDCESEWKDGMPTNEQQPARGRGNDSGMQQR